jgi:hypothetical protein
MNRVGEVAAGIDAGPLDQGIEVGVAGAADVGNPGKLHFGNADRLLPGPIRPAGGSIRHHSSLSLPSTG